MGPFQGPQFFWHFDNHQVLDFVILNHIMQNRVKLTHFEQDSGLKPHKIPHRLVYNMYRFEKSQNLA